LLASKEREPLQDACGIVGIYNVIGMQTERKNKNSLPQALTDSSLPPEWGLTKTKGKVRVIYDPGDGTLIIISTDRLSAFDRQVGLVPNRGQVLNQLSQFWFKNTSDIIPNHMLHVPHPNVMVVRKTEPVKVEFVMRGYLTGSTGTSIWTRYEKGEREFGGITLPDGMKKGDLLPRPILDPTSKAESGHDKNLTKEEIIKSGLLTLPEYDYLEEKCLALFERALKLYGEVGLKFIDTKYEFGRDLKTHEFLLIDEANTPDSSRIANQLGDHYDKEYVRLWINSMTYDGEGNLPEIPDDIIREARRRYIQVYESLAGNKFIVPEGDVNKRIVKNIGLWLGKNEN